MLLIAMQYRMVKIQKVEQNFNHGLTLISISGIGLCSSHSNINMD